MLTLSPWWCRAADADGNAAALPPLTYESLSISSLFVVVIQKWVGPPDYCTVLVRHCPPTPPPCRSSRDVAATATVDVVIVLPEHAIVIVMIFILVLLFLRIVRNPVPPSTQQHDNGNSDGHKYDQNEDGDEASHWGAVTTVIFINYVHCFYRPLL